MNDLREIANKYNFKIKSLKVIGNVTIIESDKGNFVYKENNNFDTYDYLTSRGFTFFPKVISDKDSKYEIVEYINERNISNEQRLNDLIHITGYLHHKTSFNKDIDIDELKKMYETMQDDTNYLMNYYHDLNNYIDNVTFMSPSEYLLVSNIDLFYYLLSFVKVESTNWYDEVSKNNGIRYSMIHGNLKLNHLLEGNNIYLTSWNKAHIDIPVKDLINIYQDNYNLIDLEDLVKEYEKENKLTKNEKLLFLLNLSIPKRIEFTKNTYLDSYNISKYLVYLRKIASIVQKNDKMRQKS